MALTPESFGRLALSEQLHVLLSHGIFLNLRFEETYAVTHYLLNGFFADLNYSVCCSTSCQPSEKHRTAKIPLPAGAFSTIPSSSGPGKEIYQRKN